MTLVSLRNTLSRKGFSAVLLAGVLLYQPAATAAVQSTGKIAVDLQSYLTGQSDEIVRVLVVLRDRVNTKQFENMSAYRSVRHEMIVSALQEKASQTQAEILQYLEEEKLRNEVRRYRSFWITNLVAVEATARVILEIAERPEVEMVYLDYPVELIQPVSAAPAPQTAPGAAEPGLIDINAHKLWEIGIDGSGVIVMNIDTGVDGAHPSFAARWRGNEPGVDWSWAWFDPDRPGLQFPSDYGYHGTHTMGTLTGLDPNTADTIGVAVGAQWIAAAWNYTNLNKFISDVIQEFNWGADPDGDPQTTDDVPAVISNSWGVGVLFGQPPCDESFWEAIDNAEAAGAAVVFAAGNEGSGAQTLRAPADRNTTPTNCYAVGALNPGSETIASFSSRGPTACPGTTEERIKPEVCARGVTVRSAYPGGSYWNLDGTSMACPHVAGALALLRDAYPNATVDELKTALMETAVDLGTTGEDNTYGHGLIDVWAAYNSLLGTGGGIPCDDVSDLRGRCRAGTGMKILVRLSTDYTGETVEVTVNGTDVWSATVTGNRAVIEPTGYGAGNHTVVLSEPDCPEWTIDVSCATATARGETDLIGDEELLWEDEGSVMKGSSVPAVTDLIGQPVIGLAGNYPNPFNPSTTIRYLLAADSRVTLKVYNTLGQEVATLVDGFESAGQKSALWNGRANDGAAVASGIYIYRLTAGDVVKSEKMMLMK